MRLFWIIFLPAKSANFYLSRYTAPQLSDIMYIHNRKTKIQLLAEILLSGPIYEQKTCFLPIMLSSHGFKYFLFIKHPKMEFKGLMRGPWLKGPTFHVVRSLNEELKSTKMQYY